MNDSPSPRYPLPLAVADVVRNGNCSGCGLCALAFHGIEMDLSQDGFARPAARAEVRLDQHQLSMFAASCPGSRVNAAAVESDGAQVHPIFGRVEGVWQGWATDGEIRFSGSSGGVLTALARWLSETDPTAQVVGTASDPDHPSRSRPMTVRNRAEALRSAGSRYAPVSVLPAVGQSGVGAVVLKPCEAAAYRAYAQYRGDEDVPLLLSFFCAGTPSQWATDDLLRDAGIDPGRATEVRYRGNGWPGRFVAGDGMTSMSMSYDESWGGHFGPAVQARCKICVDGTGEHADIAVGDYWNVDERGYPVFDDAAGVSVVIARTVRGLAVIQEALRAGVIEVQPVSLDEVAAVQPLQVERRRALLGRLLGRRLRGSRVPSYGGFPLAAAAVAHPLRFVRATLGSFRRRRPRELPIGG